MASGNYREIGLLEQGEELMNLSPHVSTHPVRVIAVHKQRLHPHQMEDAVVTVGRGACGAGRPLEDLAITRNHAIKCDALAEEYGLSDREMRYAYTYPAELPSEYVQPGYRGEFITSVCNVDVGNPDIWLNMQGLLTESWDGHRIGERRNNTFEKIRDTPLMERYIIQRIEDPLEVAKLKVKFGFDLDKQPT